MRLHSHMSFSHVRNRLVAGLVAAMVLASSAPAKAWDASVIDGAKAKTAAPSADAHRPSFLNDILPLLSKAGCNGSGCHSKPKAPNGYTLSVFSFDPEADYYETVAELRGRRVSPAAPEQSLLLLKPTLGLPHEGGQRFEAGSEAYRTIVRWIEQGLPYRLDDEPTLEEIEIEPDTRRVSAGEEGTFRVEARYSDGSRRDVSAMTDFGSSDPSFVAVDESGQFRVPSEAAPGEAAVVARYMGEVAISRVVMPPETTHDASAYSGFVRRSFIDELAVERWRELGLLPSDGCSDHEFLRRASLDLIGTLPSPDRARRFLEDDSPDKRDRLVDELLGDPAWADHWAIKWVDLLRPNPDRVGVKSVYVLDQWIRESFRRNVPYDQFARELVAATGSTHRDGPAVVLRDRRDPEEIATSMSRILLGVRLECAQCHHHPNERWSQSDFYQLAAYFGELKRKGTGLSPPISGGAEVFHHAPGGEVRHPVTQAVMTPKPPLAAPVDVPPGSDPRASLVTWMTAPDNPFFARALVNRVWAEIMGIGFVNPVDDFRVSNPASHPRLLDALADDFAANGFDLKHLMRTIANSGVYQLRTLPNATNGDDTRHFSRAYRRRLPAEVLTDAVAAVTGVPDTFDGMPTGARAIETWNFKIGSDMLDAFGRPDSSEDCPCERTLESSVVQALHLMNSNLLHEKLTHPSGRVTTLVDNPDLPESGMVTELYLAAYSRFPSEEEMSVALAEYSREGATRRTATEDILWALVNSAEFVFNH